MNYTVEPVCGDQRKILEALKQSECSAADLCQALWGHREDGGPDAAMGSIRMDVMRLRRKLVPSWRIVTVRVYRLERAS